MRVTWKSSTCWCITSAPGVMDDLGLGSAAMTALDPRLVYCNLSAFGPAGPMQRNPGYEPMVQAFAGLFSINGYPDRPGARIGTSRHRSGQRDLGRARLHDGATQTESTGKGCVVDASLYETALGLLTVHFARFQRAAKLPEPASERQPRRRHLPGLRYERRPGHRRRRQ